MIFSQMSRARCQDGTFLPQSQKGCFNPSHEEALLSRLQTGANRSENSLSIRGAHEEACRTALGGDTGEGNVPAAPFALLTSRIIDRGGGFSCFAQDQLGRFALKNAGVHPVVPKPLLAISSPERFLKYRIDQFSGPFQSGS